MNSWGCFAISFFRPIIAVTVVLFVILLGWLAAWKLVLVHVPLVQEVCGLRKKKSSKKPPAVYSKRLSHLYKSS